MAETNIPTLGLCECPDEDEPELCREHPGTCLPATTRVRLVGSHPERIAVLCDECAAVWIATGDWEPAPGN